MVNHTGNHIKHNRYGHSDIESVTLRWPPLVVI